MSFRTIHNNRLIDGEKLDKLSLTAPINLDEIPREAPKDWKEYVRKDWAWSQVVTTEGSVASVTGTMVDNTDPANPIILSDSTKANDNSVVHLSGNETIAGTKTFSSDVVITDGDGAVEVREYLLHGMSTGVHSGCNLTRPNSTQFAISAGVIDRIDNSTTPHTYAEYSFAGGTYNNNFLSSAFTYVLIGIDGTVYQQDTEPTMANFTDKAYIGVIANSSGVQIASSSRAYSITSIWDQLQEFFRIQGAINVKGSIQASANGANTSINTSPWTIWRLGANFDNSIYSPNSAPQLAKTPLQFVQYYTNADGTLVPWSLVSTMNTSQYNNGGTLATLATNRYCNHRLYMSPNGFGLMLFGTVIYNSKDLAVAGRATEKWLIPGLIGDQAPVAWITVRGQTTNLSNTTYNDIFSVVSFSGGAGGAGGTGSGGGDMLAATYDPAGIAQQVVGTTATQTISNKTIALGSNSVSGTLAQFNTAITDADITPTSTTITINGTSQDLSQNRSWTIATGEDSSVPKIRSFI